VTAQTAEWRNRRYGKISGESIEILLGQWREAWALRESLIEHMRSRPLEFLVSRLDGAPAWWHLYTISFEEFGVFQTKVMGIANIVAAAAATDSPTDDFVREMKNVKLPDAPPEELKDEAMAAAFVLQTNLEAIAHYSLSMHELAARFSPDKGGLKAIQRAAGIDVSVLALPKAQSVLRALQLKSPDESKLFSTLMRAPVKGPHGNIAHRELRWIEYIIRERGAFESCTQEEIHDLLVNRLHLYPDDETSSSKESLFKLIRNWRRAARN
jgi:hypothetical protein